MLTSLEAASHLGTKKERNEVCEEFLRSLVVMHAKSVKVFESRCILDICSSEVFKSSCKTANMAVMSPESFQNPRSAPLCVLWHT